MDYFWKKTITTTTTTILMGFDTIEINLVYILYDQTLNIGINLFVGVYCYFIVSSIGVLFTNFIYGAEIK